jgi:hypothetical protein
MKGRSLHEITSVIVNYLYIREAFRLVVPSETDAVLVIYPNTVLSFAVTAEPLKPISRQHGKVLQSDSVLQPIQSDARRHFYLLKRPFAMSKAELLRSLVAER